MNVEVLDEAQTEAALEGHRFGKAESTLSKISESLMPIVGTGSSVFVTGLTESTINSLRTRMYRRNVVITVRKIERTDGTKGHLIKGAAIAADEQG